MKIYDILDMTQQKISNSLWDSGTGFPAGPVANQYFYRTDATSIGLWTYDGSQWRRISSDYVVPVGPTDPVGTPKSGELFFNSTSGTLKIYEGGAWKPVIEIDAATTSAAGVVTLATDTEVDTGTNGTKAVTPLAVRTSYAKTAGAARVGFDNAIGLPASPTTVQEAIVSLDTKISGGASFRGLLYSGDDLRNYLPIIAGDQWKYADSNAGTITCNDGTLSAVAGNDIIANNGMTTNAQVLVASFAVIAASVPLASESAAGIIQIAKTAEAVAGSINDRALTPLKLNQAITNDESVDPNPYKATTSNQGVTQTATQAEVNAAVDNQKYVTPATLAAATSVQVGDASETVRGVVEIATQTEVNAGSVGIPYVVTPVTLAGRTATLTRTGLIELATQNEVNTGVDSSRAVTPSTLKSNQASNIAARVFTISGITGSGSIQHDLNSQNVSVEFFESVSQERVFCGWTPTSGIIVDISATPPSGVTLKIVVKRLD